MTKFVNATSPSTRQESAAAAFAGVAIKAPSTPVTMLKQRSTLLPKTATMSNEFIVKFRPFDKVVTYSFVRSFVRFLRAWVRPTLDPSAETIWRSSALAQGEEGNW